MRITNSVPGAPLVAGLTPYTLLAPGSGTGTTVAGYPPDIEHARLERYDEYVALVENRPYDVFADLKLAPEQRTKIVLALALPELLMNVWADAVWGDPPSVEFGASGLQDRFDLWSRENDLDIVGWESVFSASMRGTSILKLRNDETDSLEPIRLDEVSASIFFPNLKRGSDREFESVVLAWEEDRADPGARKPDYWLVREVHALVNGNYTITYEERKRNDRGGWREARPTQVTKLDFIPIVDLHGARWSGRYWGMSELVRVTTIIDEVDNRLSDIAEVLEYHGKPMLQVPAAVIPNGVLQKGADRTVGIRNPELKDVTRYITYDGMIDQQLAALDKLIDLALLTCEVPSTYFGMNADGGAYTGTALKLRLQNYLKKASRWQRREAKRLRTLAEFVARIDGASVQDARDTNISLGSPLPADDEQEARIESLLTGGEVLSSRRTSIQKLRRVDDVDAEIAAIEKDQASGGGGTAPPPAPPGLAAAGVAVQQSPAPQTSTLTPPTPPSA